MTQTIEMALPETEQQVLVDLEQKIAVGMKTFIEVGTALMRIRDERLYRAEYGTFEDYCRERWGFTRMHASRLIAAAEVVRNVTDRLQIQSPANIEQTRPLTRLEPDQQREAWGEAVATAPNGKPTAAHVETVVRRFIAPEPPQTPVADEVDEYLEQLTDDPDGYDWSSEQPLVVSSTKPHVSHNSGNNEWYTPAEYIDAARRVMGEIDLDPASNPTANTIVNAKVFYTAEDDGLSKEWRGRIWMNPPYASELVRKFAAKMAYHWRANDISEAIILVNNATETEWFRTLIDCATAVAFPHSRVKFWQPNGDLGAPLQGQALIYLGDNPTGFRTAYRHLAWSARI